MTKRGIQIHVGTAEDMGRRFVDAWRRAARGERVREEHLMFVDRIFCGTWLDRACRERRIQCQTRGSLPRR